MGTASGGKQLRGRIAITGIGESGFSDAGGVSADRLVYNACLEAIEDAGLTPSDIDGVVVENSMTPDTVSTSEISESLGFDRRFSAHSLNVGAGIVASPLLAAQAIEQGLADHVISYFGSDWGTEREQKGSFEGGPYSYHTKKPYKRNLEIPFGYVTQAAYIGAFAQRHMHEFGTTTEQLGEIAIQTRTNAAENEKALKQEPLIMQDYLDSPMLADPFRLLDCCLISDGAGAFVMSSAEAAQEAPTSPVYVKGVGTGTERTSTNSGLTQQHDFTRLPGGAKSGPKAYEMAGVSPSDIDFAELYDSFTITTLIQLEELGFCEKGEGGTFVEERGITVEDGDLPVNTHGGLLSQAYLLGINHVIEAVRQLRGTADNQVEDASLGVVAGEASCEHSTLILGTEEERQ